VLPSPPRRYWWVNQNKTFRHEVGGGYLWSPKTKKNNQPMKAYENMRAIAPGDVIFSFHNSVFAAVGIALTTGYDCIVPPEFAKAAELWNLDGWRVDVQFSRLTTKVAPKQHMALLRPLLPPLHSPLQANGNGVMFYLFEISETFAQVIAGLVGPPANEFVRASRGELLNDSRLHAPETAPIKEWEDHIQSALLANPRLDVTSKKALINARVGQGRFKENVRAVENSCRITGVFNGLHLIGSHIKPWRHSSNEERLDGENGLLLTPSIDHLFDKGHISFKNNGSLLISPAADRESLLRMGVRDESSVIIKPFSPRQQRHLEFHRDRIFASPR
jgi:putative restriction endonuclease